jgi:hypothetical protein
MEDHDGSKTTHFLHVDAASSASTSTATLFESPYW